MQDRYLSKAKRKDNGEWVQGVPFEIEGKTVILINDTENLLRTHYLEENMWTSEIYAIEVDPSTICRCTGLKDKHGNLIWENDIVNGSIKRGAAFYRCLVLWNECKARFDVRALGCNFQMTLDECADDISMSGFDYEVVGNKFDNPELLEE